YAVNSANERIVVNSVSMNDFCSGRIPEVRVLTKGLMKYKRNTDDIIAYARRCVGQEGYNASTNNCADFANRVVFR
ncbi:MAG: lecithin retinol acyltransferase family protein, partial [Oscillospiraceae bacterium]|nr:lecithin retinol acyltransferase family protein [Oscillospiraceae bacterium]